MKKLLLLTLLSTSLSAQTWQITPPPGDPIKTGGGGGGAGNPCTSTALSLQYNASGSFGCVAGITSDGTNLTGTGTAKVAIQDKGGQVYNVLSYGVVAGDVDSAGANSTAMLALLATVNTAGGGTIFFPPGTYRFDSQLLIPNDGTTPQPSQKFIRLTGTSIEDWSQTIQTGSSGGGSILDLRYQNGVGGKIETLGLGGIKIDHLTLKDGGSALQYVAGAQLTNIVVASNVATATFTSLPPWAVLGAWFNVAASGVTALNFDYGVTAVNTGAKTITFTTSGVSNGTYNAGGMTISYGAPMIHSTNTTMDIRNNSLIGYGGLNVQTSSQDAIVLGGATTNLDGSSGAAFQGYGTVIDSNSFTRFNRMLYARTYANGIVFKNNGERESSGVYGIHCDGSYGGGSSTYGLNASGNTIEMSGYKYFAYLDTCIGATFLGNGLYDPVGQTSFFFLTGLSLENTVMPSALDGETTIPMFSSNDASIGLNSIFGAHQQIDSNGYAKVGSQAANGMEVLGEWDNTKLTTGYPGQFTIVEAFEPQSRLSMGVLGGGSPIFGIDAYTIGVGARNLQLNPSGGLVSTGGALTAGGLFTLKGSAGASTTAAGSLNYDTTNKSIHAGANSVDTIVALLPSSVTPANNDCVKFTVASSVVTLNTAGAACGSGGGGTPGGSNTQFQINNAGAFGGLLSAIYTGSLGAASEGVEFYNSTATTGVTSVLIREGAGQGGAFPFTVQGASVNDYIKMAVGVGGGGLFMGSNSVGVTLEIGGAVPGMNIGANAYISWQSVNRIDSGSKDTGISRASAGVLAIGNGTQGDFTGTLKLTAPGASAGDTPVCISTGNIVHSAAVTCGTSVLADKFDVAGYSHGLDYLMSMRPVEFNVRGVDQPGADKTIGFIADEMANLNPLLGSYVDGKLTNYRDRAVLATLVKAVQELNAKVDAITVH